MVVTGGGSGMHDLAWLRAQARDGERVADLRRVEPVVRARAVRAEARDVLAAATVDDVSNNTMIAYIWQGAQDRDR